ncbi:MAG: hypothetical protein ACT4NP_19415 [Pseudonocardiales bacterium]
MTNLLDEVEHIVSGVQPELRREQNNVIVVLPEAVRETLQDEDHLGAGHFAAQTWHLERLCGESVWTQQKSLDRASLHPAQHACAEQDAPPTERRRRLHDGTCPQTGVARPPDAGQKMVDCSASGTCLTLAT